MNQADAIQTDSQGLKSRLVDVATELLVVPRAVKLPTMREIASAAGVAPGAAYRHFASQEELFMAVITHLFASLEAALVEAAESSRGLRATVRNVALGYVDWGVQNPGGYQLLFETTDDEEILKLGLRPGSDLIEKLATRIAPRGKPKPGHIEKLELLAAGLHGVVSLRIHKKGANWMQPIDGTVDALIRAIFRP